MKIAMVPSARHGRRWIEVLALIVCLSASAGASYSPAPERFTAFAVSMTNGAAGRSSNLELVIDRWSTPADRDDLAAALDEQGPEGLLKRLQGRPRIGYVRAAGRLGNDIQFARKVQHSDGSRRIVIVLARRLSFNEVNPSSTTEDYPFTVIELRLDAAGGGDGRMSVGAKITVHKGSDQIEHEDYTGGNVLLKDVKVS
jgi:hypothetical protein